MLPTPLEPFRLLLVAVIIWNWGYLAGIACLVHGMLVFADLYLMPKGKLDARKIYRSTSLPLE